MTPATTTTDADPLLGALRARGSRIRRVRYRMNRTVLLSVSRDGRTLNSHACFRDAPRHIADAVARYLTAARNSAAARDALARLRGWEGTRRGLEEARETRPRRTRRRTNGPDTAPVRELFRQFNTDRFGGRLPAVPLRISRRMTRSLGTIRYGDDGPDRDGRRSVSEIAISADLLLPANRSALEDTLLHEMAHAADYLFDDGGGHGASWRRWARYVGCREAACAAGDIRRRDRRRVERVTRVPPLPPAARAEAA